MSRFLFLGLLAFALLLLGLISLNGAVLVLVLPLALYIGAALLYGPDPIQLEAERQVSADRVVAGMPVEVRLSVKNTGRALEQVLLEDRVPGGLEVIEGEPKALASLPAGGTLEIVYTVRAMRGGFELSAVRVTTSDHLGLLRRQAVLQAPARFSALPETARLRRIAIQPRRTRTSAGPVPSRQGGSGVDFYGVREYQMGDPRRWINWRASARHPRFLFTNEFEQERIADVGLILDARRRSDVGAGEGSLFEHSVRAAASLADRFLSDGNRVGLLVYGRSLDWTFPGYGKVQRERILRALARAQTGESQVFDRLDYLPTGYFPAQSQLVLISPLSLDDLPMLVRLRARRYEVLVIRPDPLSVELQSLEPGPGVTLASRIVTVERALLKRKLQQAGIQVVDWRVDQAFDGTIHAALGRRPQGFRAVAMEV